MASLIKPSGPVSSTVRESSPSHRAEELTDRILHLMGLAWKNRGHLGCKGQDIAIRVNDIFENAKKSSRPLSDLEKTRVVHLARGLAVTGDIPIGLKVPLCSYFRQMERHPGRDWSDRNKLIDELSIVGSCRDS